MQILEVGAYGFALWLGFYLIARDAHNPRLRFTGLGLVAYALGLAGDLLAGFDLELQRWVSPLLFLPVIFWSGAALHLLPDHSETRPRLTRFWNWLILPLAVLFYGLGAAINLALDGPTYLHFGALVALPMLIAFVLILIATFGSAKPKRPFAVLLVVTVTLGLGVGLLAFPLAWLPRIWVLLAITADLVALGIGVAVLDAFDQGENLLPDMLRSLDFSFFAALLFGGLVGLTMALSSGVTLPMLALLLAIIGAAIFTQTFSDTIQSALDGVAFVNLPQVRRGRADLRAAASALPRTTATLDLTRIEEAEFARLTRRALSNYGNLPRLASSPLTHLPIVEARLAQGDPDGNTLARANALKVILAESISRLKPPGDEDFGSTDEWRYYNALFFPYVAGLKVHSRRVTYDGLSATEREALQWFQTYVPERTLFNWQNAAAALVARDLLERNRDLPG